MLSRDNEPYEERVSYHDTGAAIAQDAVYPVGLSSYPAVVGVGEKDIPWVVVEHVLEGCGRVQHVTSSRVYNPFGLACGAAEEFAHL